MFLRHLRNTMHAARIAASAHPLVMFIAHLSLRLSANDEVTSRDVGNTLCRLRFTALQPFSCDRCDRRTVWFQRIRIVSVRDSREALIAERVSADIFGRVFSQNSILFHRCCTAAHFILSYFR